MKKDELIHMWEEENDRLFRNEKTDKDMITQYLNEKTLKGNRSIKFNLIFYGLIQLVNMVLLSMNLAGYLNNTSMIWLLASMLAITVGTLVFGMDVFYRFREINNYSDSLQNLIQKQLWFYRRPYELWLVLASISAIILASNINLYVDNDNGSYVINNKALFAGITLGMFVFIYGGLKLTSILGLRKLKAYLSDLQAGSLDQSKQIEQGQKKYLCLWVLVFVVLTVTMILGILRALP
jgi:hypothetical protein